MDCFFCQRNTKEIDFKNTDILKKYISGLGKIRPRKKTGFCAKHQRQFAVAVKRARHMALLSPNEK